MKLLIVEDSKLLVDRLCAGLVVIGGIEMLVEAGVGAAIARFRSERPPVVILDLQLVDGSGIEVLRAIKRERPATQVLMFSNHVDCRRQCEAEGADRFFDKALEFESLRETVRDLAAALSARPAGDPAPGERGGRA